jgi:hypothetical protein
MRMNHPRESIRARGMAAGRLDLSHVARRQAASGAPMFFIER